MSNPIQQQFDKAEQVKTEMLALISACSEALRKEAPAEGQWNMIQVMEHLLAAEKAILRQLEKYGHGQGKKASLGAALRSWSMTRFLRSPAKIKVPKAAAGIEPSGIKGYEEVKNEWDSVRASMQDWLHTYPMAKAEHYVFKHPVAGLLTPMQTFRFMEDHIVHHIMQIKRIRQALS
jgi:hypothetical protein